MDSEYISRRAEVMALSYLTRNPNLLVKRGDDRINFVVELLHGDRPTGATFGVNVMGQLDPLFAPELAKVSTGDNSEQFLAQELSLPVCYFLFTMKDNLGFYRWIVEPVIGDGKAFLSLNHQGSLTKLDPIVANKIFAQIEQWYSLQQSFTRNTTEQVALAS